MQYGQDELEQRLVELETRLAFQEQALTELSQALAEARLERARTDALLQAVLADLRGLRGTLYADPGSEPPPPNYGFPGRPPRRNRSRALGPFPPMTDTLRDQLLNLGFKAPATERRPQPRKDGGGKPRPQPPSGARKGGPQGQGGRGRDAGQAAGQRREGAPRRKPAGEMDLGKAWALRAQQEKQERLEAEQRRQEEARQRR